MDTFADYIKAVVEEPIEAMVIGKYGGDWPHIYSHNLITIPEEKLGVILSGDEALSLLVQPYEGGYGSPDCHAVYIWTKTRVYWVTQYDGSTSLDSAPRNPEPVMPIMPGG